MEAIEIVLTMLCIGGFGLVLLRLRAVDRRAEESRASILGAIGSLKEDFETVRALHAPGRPAPSHVAIEDEVVPLDAETIARLEAVTATMEASGGLDALHAALARGLAMAERGFEVEAKQTEATKPREPGKEESGEAAHMERLPRESTPEIGPRATTEAGLEEKGKVVRLRPRGKPPGDDSGGAG